MNFSVERPAVLYALLLLVPASAYSVARFRHLVATLGQGGGFATGASLPAMRRRFALRVLLRLVSAACLVLSCAGVYWGAVSVPVQKSGSAVSLVFDVSYSMLADDAPGGLTRLEASRQYALGLLDNMRGTGVSVVIAKGDGAVLVPLTDDFETVRSAVRALSPQMMTAAGSSLGSGVECALGSFPRQSARAGHVWLFTDGDETDSALQPALSLAVRQGIPVCVVGFGSAEGTEVLAGDGVTTVHTALRADQLQKTVAAAERRVVPAKTAAATVRYVDAAQVGSAYALLNGLRGAGDEVTTAYQVGAMDRHSLFLLLAIVSFALSFVCSEGLPGGILHKRGVAALSAAMAVMLLTGCSARFKGGAKILEGRINWNRKNYQEAVADFLQAGDFAESGGDGELADYALYALASTYLMQDEAEAALRRFEALPADAPQAVRFSALYNLGIVAHRRGDYRGAASYFRDALLVDGTSVDAKINLELSLQQSVAESDASAQELSPVLESPGNQGLEQALFSVIRENEQTIWKSQQQEPERQASDY